MVETVVPTLAPVWQVAHPVEMPAWFIAGLGLAKPPVLVLVVEWHASHAAVVGVWFAGLPITTVVPKVAPVWQLAQFDVLLFAVWFIVQCGAAKPPVLVLVAG